MLSRQNTQRLIWFGLGTFLGGWVLGFIGSLLGKAKGG